MVIMLTAIMVMTETFIEKITKSNGDKEPDSHVWDANSYTDLNFGCDYNDSHNSSESTSGKSTAIEELRMTPMRGMSLCFRQKTAKSVS